MFIRNAKLSDIPALLVLEDKCWDAHLRASAEIIANRITSYSEGQYVCEMNGNVCGVLYTQKISSIDDLRAGCFANQSKLHSASGNIIQLLSIGADNSVAGDLITSIIVILIDCFR